MWRREKEGRGEDDAGPRRKEEGEEGRRAEGAGLTERSYLS
jgi:hypothetical protein